MKKVQISESTKRGLRVLITICLTVLIFTFIELVDVWLLQDSMGDFNVGDLKKQITGDNLAASEYTDTVEEALLSENGGLDAYQCNIDEEIFRMRNGDFMVIYYRAVGVKEEAFVYARFRVLEQDNQERYVLVGTEVDIRNARDKSGSITAVENIYNHTVGALLDFINYIEENHDDIDENNRVIVYGDICETYFAQGESIYSLQIDGQKPDEIKEYECFGKKYYFWYYDNLETEKAISQDLITLTEDGQNTNERDNSQKRN